MRCLILGGAACVWDDLAQAQALGTFDAVVAVNDIGAAYPGELDLWATLHPEHFHRWLKERERKVHPKPRALMAHEGCGYDTERRAGFKLDYTLPELWTPGGSSGSSGLFGTRGAIEVLCADRDVLCGVPMDPARPHFYGGWPWKQADNFWPAWEAALPFMRDKARSMSGRTRELLGPPTPEWLAA